MFKESSDDVLLPQSVQLRESGPVSNAKFGGALQIVIVFKNSLFC